MIYSLRLVVLVPLASYLPGTSQESSADVENTSCTGCVSTHLIEIGCVFKAKSLLVKLGTGILSTKADRSDLTLSVVPDRQAVQLTESCRVGLDLSSCATVNPDTRPS
jgi:hypothetical protein